MVPGTRMIRRVSPVIRVSMAIPSACTRAMISFPTPLSPWIKTETSALAPKPVLIMAKERDYFDIRGSEEAFGRLKQLYRLLGDDGRNGMFVDELLILLLHEDDKIIETLDILPRAVLIEVVIAEIALTNDLRYGLEYFVPRSSMKIKSRF
jgi:hypothetical protein